MIDLLWSGPQMITMSLQRNLLDTTMEKPVRPEWSVPGILAFLESEFDIFLY